MANSERCGAKTQKGGACRYALEECPWPDHAGGRARHGVRAVRRPSAARSAPPPEVAPAEAVLPAAVDARDLRALGWWLIEEVVAGRMVAPAGGLVATVMRILIALGPEPLSKESALREAALIGRVMGGQPPRDAEEWALAESLFEPEALAEFRRWEERDGARG